MSNEKIIKELQSLLDDNGGSVKWEELPPQHRVFLIAQGIQKDVVSKKDIIKTFGNGNEYSHVPKPFPNMLGTLNHDIPTFPSDGNHENQPETTQKEGPSLLLQAIRQVIEKVDRPYKAIPFYALLKHGELSSVELKDLIMKYGMELLNLEFSHSTLKKAMSVVNTSPHVYKRDDEITKLKYYMLTKEAKEKILQAYEILSREQEIQAELERLKEADKEEIANAFAKFFREYIDDEDTHVYMNRIADLLVVKSSKSLEVDFAHLEAFNPELAERLLNNPEDTIEVAGEALSIVLAEDFFKENVSLHIRFYNLPRTLYVRDVGSEHINRFIQVEGIVSRQTEHKPYVSKATFVCKACGNKVSYLQKPYLPLVRPDKCEKCGSKNIGLVIEESTFLNAQYFRIQDLPDAMTGVNARALECVVLDDLVDSFLPGDRVRVTGILRIVMEKKDGLPIFKKILEVNHIDVITKQIKDIELSQQEIKKIEDLAKRKDIVDLITNSIAPSIYGYEDIKKGIALALFSGGDWIAPDNTVTRGRSHVLLLGDPGTAKSSISRFLQQIIPRGVWTTAKTSSAAGLTAAAVRDEFTGSWVLEAGALVLANGGICVIDEFDKMNEKDRAAIHEALEQGTISISKAGINVMLSAKTTVIAIGNPKEGRFNLHKKITEQITFPPTLLSRFDLIFVLIDQPNKEKDEAIAEHILEYKIGGDQTKESEFISSELLKKYIAYARQNCDPKFSKEAREALKRYYVKVRSMAKPSEDGTAPVPITARQLEALTRLAKARARMRLSDVVTKEDAEDVIKLMENTLRKVAMDEEGNIDVSIIEVGKSAKEIDRETKILDIIKELQDLEDWGAPKDDILKEAARHGMSMTEAKALLERLLNEKRIYMPRGGYYKVRGEV